MADDKPARLAILDASGNVLSPSPDAPLPALPEMTAEDGARVRAIMQDMREQTAKLHGPRRVH